MSKVNDVDRVSAILLAKTIRGKQVILAEQGKLSKHVEKLNLFGLFTVGEISEISGLTQYRVRKVIGDAPSVRGGIGVYPRHMDHLLRMVTDKKFARLHAKVLVEDLASVPGISRVTGISDSSIRRWAKGD